MKICSKCNINKNESEFGRYSRNKNGLNHQCKECRRKYHNSYISNTNYKTDYWKKNPEKNRKKVAKSGEKSRQNMRVGYIKKLLIISNGIPKKNITEDVIDLKKMQLTAYRLSKQIKTKLKEGIVK